MILEDYKVLDDDKIILSKKELENWKAHYSNVACSLSKKDPNYKFKRGFYIGKADALCDIMKMFDDLEG